MINRVPIVENKKELCDLKHYKKPLKFSSIMKVLVAITIKKSGLSRVKPLFNI
jgi:hypothetical protein